MSDPLCKHCGREMSQHRNITSTVMGPMRVCGVFEAKPEPLKAKPGVRYRNIQSALWADRIGTVSGQLAFSYHLPGWDYRYSLEPMSADWVEVPEETR